MRHGYGNPASAPRPTPVTELVPGVEFTWASTAAGVRDDRPPRGPHPAGRPCGTHPVDRAVRDPGGSRGAAPRPQDQAVPGDRERGPPRRRRGSERTREPPVTETVTVGDATVTALLDSEGPFFLPLSEAFPSVDPNILERAELLDPDPRPSPDRWWLAFRVYVVQAARAAGARRHRRRQRHRAPQRLGTQGCTPRGAAREAARHRGRPVSPMSC